MRKCASKLFPRFAELAPRRGLEHVLPPASAEELASLEANLRVALPRSYKALLACARRFWLLGGAIQFGSQHPFFHDFEPFEQLTPPQQHMVSWKGGQWPLRSQGMLCFAEFFMEADGDQVLFDISSGLLGNDYPVMYYAHEQRPASIRRLSNGFAEFMESFLDYPAFHDEDAGAT